MSILKSILNTLKHLAAQLGFSGRLIAKKLSQDGGEAIRDCRGADEFANADHNPNEKLAFSNRGRSRQNEQGNLAVGAALIEKLNSLGGKWGPPVWCNEQGVDCFSQDGGEKLSIQITKISPEDYFEDLNVRGFATREQDIPSWEASDLADAIRSCESPVPIPQTRSAFHPARTTNRFRRRDARQQSRSFARENPPLRHTPHSTVLSGALSALARSLPTPRS